jgi:transketolase
LPKQPYATVMKPYGRALVELARERTEVLCLTGDLTRQGGNRPVPGAVPERFIHAGMAEPDMLRMAGALARRGFLPFVHTFGVFATRRPLDQIVNSVASPNLPVRIVGLMPGVTLGSTCSGSLFVGEAVRQPRRQYVGGSGSDRGLPLWALALRLRRGCRQS